jgi:DNA-binding response OmpR family regulator
MLFYCSSFVFYLILPSRFKEALLVDCITSPFHFIIFNMKKILLIEDDLNMADNIKELLELTNYQVLVADNGKLGVEKALAQSPDLIICDIKMPALDGFGVLHAIQKNEHARNIPFIFLTGSDTRSDYRRAMDLGVDDFITKPFEPTELLNAIDIRMKKKDASLQFALSNIDNFQTDAHLSNGMNVFEALTDNCQINTYKKKETIFTEGNHLSGVYFIIEGRVKTYKTNDIGKALAIDLYNTGDIFGYASLFEGTSHEDNAVALENTSLAVIPKKDFFTLLNNNHQAAQLFIKLMATNIISKEEKLIGIAFNSLRKKVSDALVILLNKFGDSQEEQFTINISRDHLASIAGTATESLVRTLGEFKAEKLIDVTRDGSIRILNKRKLVNLSN